ncbi:MAG: G/U mismatch-specific DNA glycosylase [Micromonosporaceae bacterium]|nr:G/U mismatch-specific DNA glycosylase [Micromonosporaceae bacterium]
MLAGWSRQASPRPVVRRPGTVARPTAEDLAAARDRAIPDVVGPGLRVLFCGINPGLWSGALGQHFARPGNRFWPALHRSGFTPRQLRPEEQQELLWYGLGATNLATRTTARADELTRDELTAGAERLAGLAECYRPRWVAVVGVTAYRTGFGRPTARVGRQDERLGDSGLWVLPNPSGLNAHYQLDGLAEEFGKLRAAADAAAGHKAADDGADDVVGG